jgi:hypothetical protein
MNRVRSVLQKGGSMTENEQVNVVVGAENLLVHLPWWKFHGTDGNGIEHPRVVTGHLRSELIVGRYNKNLIKREPCALLQMANDLVSHEDRPKFI